jgi:hypothetical protein
VTISNIQARSGNEYRQGLLKPGHLQYIGRNYQFNHCPEALDGAAHIMTFANDKMMPETEECFSFDVEEAVSVYILYPDKQPYLPAWMAGFDRMRWNVTRTDSMADNLKGYFGVYKRDYPAGTVTLYGNSPLRMLEEDWYVDSFGADYCMYSVCVAPWKP